DRIKQAVDELQQKSRALAELRMEQDREKDRLSGGDQAKHPFPGGTSEQSFEKIAGEIFSEFLGDMLEIDLRVSAVLKEEFPATGQSRPLGAQEKQFQALGACKTTLQHCRFLVKDPKLSQDPEGSHLPVEDPKGSHFTVPVEPFARSLLLILKKLDP